MRPLCTRCANTDSDGPFRYTDRGDVLCVGCQESVDAAAKREADEDAFERRNRAQPAHMQRD